MFTAIFTPRNTRTVAYYEKYFLAQTITGQMMKSREMITEKQAWEKIIKNLRADGNGCMFFGVCAHIRALSAVKEITKETRDKMLSNVYQWSGIPVTRGERSFKAPLNGSGLEYRIKMCQNEIKKLQKGKTK